MLAVDTNVVVRYLVEDNVLQTAKVKQIIGKQDVFVPTTVILETAWVLKRAYNFSHADVMNALKAFAGLPRLELEDAGRLARALDWMASGMDFADALHLAHADSCTAFLTFDKLLVKTAKTVESCEVRSP